jgi:hypothetical protein
MCASPLNTTTLLFNHLNATSNITSAMINQTIAHACAFGYQFPSTNGTARTYTCSLVGYQVAMFQYNNASLNTSQDCVGTGVLVCRVIARMCVCSQPMYTELHILLERRRVFIGELAH